MDSKKIPTPGQVLEQLLHRIPRYIKLTFIAACIMGVITHLYMLTNKLPNHDDVGHLFSASYGTPSGRWFLPAVLQWDGNYSMPWLIGMLSILCLAITACFVVSILRIRSPLGCTITSAILVSFPSVTATFTYLFTADAYFFGAMLAALGAYLAVRSFKLSIPASVLAITLSMGIYQSYFPVAAVLMVGALIFETLDGEKTVRQLIWKGAKLVAVLAASMAAYMIIVRITTRQMGLVDYMGISSMGQLSLSQLPQLIVKCYTEYWNVLMRDTYGLHFRFLRWLMALTGVGTVALLAVVLRKRKLGILRTVLVVALVLLYPLAGNLIHIMTAGMQVHMLMIYGMAFLLVAPIAMVEYSAELMDTRFTIKQTVCAVISWVILGSMALTAYSYVVTDNKAYLKMEITLQQGIAYSNRLLSAIEGCDGYRRGLPVVLIGSNVYTGNLYPVNNLNEVKVTGALGLAELRTSYTYQYFLRYYLGYTEAVYLADSDLAISLADREEVKAMPVYPEDGSIQILDETIVVKLGEPQQPEIN